MSHTPGPWERDGFDIVFGPLDIATVSSCVPATEEEDAKGINLRPAIKGGDNHSPRLLPGGAS